MVKRNSKCKHGQPMEQTRGCFARATQVWLAVNHNTSMTSWNEFDVRSVLHGQMSFVPVN